MIYKPYEYQKRAIQFVLDKPECLLALDMGLGKSSITLTAIQELIDDCEICNALVVAPKKVAETTWTTEAAKWNHLQGMRVAKVMGTEKQRKMAMYWSSTSLQVLRTPSRSGLRPCEWPGRVLSAW